MAEAAGILGISAEAVRQRIKRSTLEVERDGGTVYVLLDADGTRPAAGGTRDRSGEYDALISRMEEEISYLRDENRRKDEIIMQQAITMRALTAPAATEEPRYAPETPAEGPNPGEDLGGQERRPWWRRIFQ